MNNFFSPLNIRWEASTEYYPSDDAFSLQCYGITFLPLHVGQIVPGV